MAKTLIDAALAHIDAQIADLTRAKAIIVEASANGGETDAPKVRKPRGPNRKRGLPSAEEGAGL